MTTIEMKEIVEDEILAKLIDEIEADILNKKEELYATGAKFMRTYAQELTSNGFHFSPETQQAMDLIRKKYNDLINEINDLIKLHNTTKYRKDEILNLVNNWIRNENLKIVKIEQYIEESFVR